MINRFRIQNYKALRDVTLDLTPLHVLIGPNDAGKTSILEALAAFCRSVDVFLPNAFEGVWTGFDLAWQRKAGSIVAFDASLSDQSGSFDYGFSCRFQPSAQAAVIEREITTAVQPPNEPLSIASHGYPFTHIQQLHHEGLGHRASGVSVDRIHDALSGVHYYRWNSNFLSLPVAPDSSRKFRMEQSGFGLARCLDDILGYDREAFGRLEARFTSIFPSLRSIKLVPEPAFKLPDHGTSPVPLLQKSEGKGIHFQFASDGGLIPAAQVSDGVLLVLAYLTVLYLPEPPRLLLVEEPENGIHPKRLGDVLKILRDLIGEQQRTQVVLTTHSPYVLDLFKPEEVTLCRKQSDGSVAVRRLSESETVRQQMDVFTLGEIWTGEGDDALSIDTPKPTGTPV